MFLSMFLRIFSDCIIMFGLLGCCPTLLPYRFSLPLAALIFGLSAGVSYTLYDRGKNTWGRLCALLPLLALFLPPSTNEIFILIVPMLYTMYICFDGMMNPEYYSYRQFFKRSLFLLAVVWVVISVALYMEDPKGLRENLVQTEVILRYAIVYFLCGVVLQRQLRLGVHQNAKGELGQIFGVLGSVGVVSAVFVVTDSLLRQNVLDMLRKVASVLIMPFAVLLEILIVFLDNIKEMRDSEEYKEAWENSSASPTESYNDLKQLLGELLEEAPEQGNSPWVMVFAALAVVILLVLMVIAFVKIRGGTNALFIVSQVKESPKQKRMSRLSNRGKVRQAYRDFLSYERQKGLVLKKHYTTADILERIATPNKEIPATQLREVYLRARYDEEREVTREAVSAARTALKEIRQ